MVTGSQSEISILKFPSCGGHGIHDFTSAATEEGDNGPFVAAIRQKGEGPKIA